MPARALEPGKIGAYRIGQTCEVGEEGTEQHQPDDKRSTDRHYGVLPVPECEQMANTVRRWGTPPSGDESCEAGCGESDDKCFLRGKHQSQTCSCHYSPARSGRLRVTPNRTQCQRGEKDQQHFVDEIAAVIDHRRRNCGEKSGTTDCPAA